MSGKSTEKLLRKKHGKTCHEKARKNLSQSDKRRMWRERTEPASAILVILRLLFRYTWNYIHDSQYLRGTISEQGVCVYVRAIMQEWEG